MTAADGRVIGPFGASAHLTHSTRDARVYHSCTNQGKQTTRWELFSDVH